MQEPTLQDVIEAMSTLNGNMVQLRNELNTKIDSLENKYDALDGKIDSIHKQMNSTRSEIDSIHKQMNSTRVEMYKEKFETLRGMMGGVFNGLRTPASPPCLGDSATNPSYDIFLDEDYGL